jgi:predicted enzyme related to lactoylglutathione lyase
VTTVVLEPTDIPTVGRLAVFVDPSGALVGLYKPVEA